MVTVVVVVAAVAASGGGGVGVVVVVVVVAAVVVAVIIPNSLFSLFCSFIGLVPVTCMTACHPRCGSLSHCDRVNNFNAYQ